MWFLGGTTKEEELDQNLQRLASATLPEDKDEALGELQRLAEECPKLIAERAYDSLVEALDDAGAGEQGLKAAVVGIVLDTVAPHEHSPEDSEGRRSYDHQYGCDLFLQNPRRLAILVDLVSDEAWEVRYNVVQILTVLVLARRAKLQGQILNTAGAVNKLVELLSDHVEHVRNPTLLLLKEIVMGNTTIQQIVAFDDTFPRVLAIVEEEDYTTGGEVVVDCLELLDQLLQTPNVQRLFLDGGHVSKLVPFFQPGDCPGTSVALRITALMVQILKRMVRIQGQCMLRDAGLLQATLELSSRPARDGAWSEVKCGCLEIVGKAVECCHDNQKSLARMAVSGPGGRSQSALTYLLQTALGTTEQHRFGLAALTSYFRGNFDGQLAAASTFAPQPTDIVGHGQDPRAYGREASFGGTLSQVFKGWQQQGSGDVIQFCTCCTVLGAALTGNKDAKVILSRQRLGDFDDTGAMLLSTCLMEMLSRGVGLDPRIRFSILLLLAIWFYECPYSIQKFLSHRPYFDLIVSTASAPAGEGFAAHARGLAAFILMLVLDVGEEDPFELAGVPNTAQVLLASITKQIGTGNMKTALQTIASSRAFAQAASPTAEREFMREPAYDRSFVEMFTDVWKNIDKRILRLYESQTSRSPSAQVVSRPAAATPSFTITPPLTTDRNKQRVTPSATASVPPPEVALLQQELAASQQAASQLRSRVAQLEEALRQRDARIQDLQLRPAANSPPPVPRAVAPSPSPSPSRHELELQAQLAELEGRLASREEELARVRQGSSQAAADLEAHARRIAELEEELEGSRRALQDELGQPQATESELVKQLRGEVSSLNAQLQTNEAHFNKALKSVSPDQARMKGLEQQVDELQQAAYISDATERRLEQRVRELEACNAELEQGTARQRASAEAAADDLRQKQEEILALRGRAEASEAEAAGLRAEMDALRQDQEDLLVMLGEYAKATGDGVETAPD